MHLTPDKSARIDTEQKRYVRSYCFFLANDFARMFYNTEVKQYLSYSNYTELESFFCMHKH